MVTNPEERFSSDEAHVYYRTDFTLDSDVVKDGH